MLGVTTCLAAMHRHFAGGLTLHDEVGDGCVCNNTAECVVQLMEHIWTTAALQHISTPSACAPDHHMQQTVSRHRAAAHPVLVSFNEHLGPDFRQALQGHLQIFNLLAVAQSHADDARVHHQLRHGDGASAGRDAEQLSCATAHEFAECVGTPTHVLCMLRAGCQRCFDVIVTARYYSNR